MHGFDNTGVGTTDTAHTNAGGYINIQISIRILHRYAFTDIMLEQLFAEVWSRDVLSIRDRRILLLGIIAEKGETSTFGIQVKAALKRGELTPDELRELLLMIAQYAGYPRAAALLGVVETKIAEVAEESENNAS